MDANTTNSGAISDPENGAPLESSVGNQSKDSLFREMTGSLIQYSPAPEEIVANEAAVKKVSKLLPQWLLLAGSHELYLPSLYKAVFIEFISTATFVYVHIAIVLACQSYTYPPLQIGIAHAVLLAFYILQFAMSSGAHFNSLITMATVCSGQTPLIRGLLYIMVQIFGAAAGADIMRRSIPEATAPSVALGSCCTGDLEPKQALAIEFFFSITLLFAAYGTAFNERQREIFGPVLPPFIIGITLGLVIFSSAALAPPPFTGAGANPSLCLGTAWANSAIVGADTAMRDQWVYWMGPLMASVVHAGIYGVAPPHHWTQSKESSDKNA